MRSKSTAEMKAAGGMFLTPRLQKLPDGSLWVYRGPGGLFKEWVCRGEERPTKRFEEVTRTAPSCWASYLINGDASGIDEADVQAADHMVAELGLGSPVGCSEESEFRWRPDYSTHGDDGRKLGSDCLTYTFLREVES